MDYSKHAREGELNRSLGLVSTTLVGVGIILGAGIYALIGEGVALAGANVWISFLAAAFVALLTGLSYAELSSMFPKAGAEYHYISHAFSNRWGFLAGWLVIIAGFVSVATVAFGFAGYFQALTGFPFLESAVGLTILTTLIVLRGVKESATIGTFFTLLETLGLVLVIAMGFSFLGSHPLVDFSIPLVSVLSAGALVFFAFIGFEDIVRLSEETKKPEKTIPKAVLLSIVISTILYVLVAIAAISIVGADALAHSSSPLADVAQHAWGAEAFLLLSIIALFSTGNTVLLFILVVSRLVYGMAREDAGLPRMLGVVKTNTGSPQNAILLTGICALFALSVGNIHLVANATAFLLFLAFIMVNVAVIWLRKTEPRLQRPFRVPFSFRSIPVLPVIGILSSLLLIISMPLDVIGIGLLITLIGAGIAWKKKY